MSTPQEDIAEMARKIDACFLILLAPLWPRREDLDEFGTVLYDEITAKAKPYALALVDGRSEDYFRIAANWAPLLTDFLNNTRIAGNEANERMVAVFGYYAGLAARWNEIEG